MQSFTFKKGFLMPIERSNIDTDAIIPKQYLKSIKKSGFGDYLFDEWRFLDKGNLGDQPSNRKANPDFVLNNPIYQDADILLAKENFGCGSSREHAVWALTDYGFQAVIAESFADIFYNNSFKSGFLPIALKKEAIDTLFTETKKAAEKGEAVSVEINLPEQTVTCLNHRFSFEIDPFRKDCLIKGLDNIGLTLEASDDIKQFEDAYRKQFPWLFN